MHEMLLGEIKLYKRFSACLANVFSKKIFSFVLMSNTTHISLSLDFFQVVDLVKQLPEDQQQQLIELIERSKKKTPAKKLSYKEKAFLKGLDEAVDFVNNYNSRKASKKSFKQMLDEL